MSGGGLRALAAGAVVAAATTWPSLAVAAPTKDAAKAEQLFEEGTRLLDEKKYDEALPKLLESQRLGPGIGVTMYLGDCYEGLGRTAKALALFREAEQMARARRDARDAVAQARIDELASRVPTVIVRVGFPIEDGIAVTLDDESLERERWQRTIELDPGTHVLRASLGHRRWETTFELPPRAAMTLVQVPQLGEPARPALPAPPEHVGREVRPMQIAGLAQITGGAIFLGIGLLYGLEAIKKQSASRDDGHCDVDAHCDPTGLALRHDGLAAARVSTVFVTLGLLAGVSGAVFTYLDLRGPSRVAAALSAPRAIAGVW